MYNKLIKDTHNYKPLCNLFEIKESNIDGMGLFVAKGVTIPVGNVVDKHNVWKQKVEVFGEITFASPVKTHIEIDLGKNSPIYRTPVGGFINHSDEPNCVIHKIDTGEGFYFYTLMALRELTEGEEVTVCYGQSKICKR